MSPESILMTGGTGFLGSNLLKRLVRDGHRVVLLKRTFSDTSRIQAELSGILSYDLDTTGLDEIFAHHRFSTILHCATNYGRKEIDPIAIIEANLILPLQLLKRGADQGATTFINTDTVLDKRMNSYSLSKKQFLDWMATYSSQLTCINVALEHFYGPEDDPSKFVSFIVREILSEVTQIDLTAGEQKRDFIYVDDVVSAFTTLLASMNGFGKGLFKFEVGSKKVITIRDFVGKVKSIAGNSTTQLNFGALPYRDNEVMESSVDTSHLNRLGWNPQISIDEGLRRTIESERVRRRSK
jgi:nucleoside-diphosphate-sugar epimerase